MTMMGSASSFLPGCESSTVDYNTYLTEDVCFEIFLHLPLNSIFRFRCVSKLWLSGLSNPIFLNRLFYSLNPPPWTVFYQLELQPDHEINPTGSFDSSVVKLVSIATPDLHFQFISGQEGFSFRFLTEACPPLNQEDIYLLTSSNGLVLCSTTKYYQNKYYVCNPLTKKWVSLPQPQNCSHERVLNGFICESSSSFTSTSYKVVRIPEFRDPTIGFDLEIFSSDTGEWITYNVSCAKKVTILYQFSKNVVSHNGVLYWIEGRRNRIMVYDHNNNKNKDGGRQCRLINLPEESGHNLRGSQCLGESEGILYYGLLQLKQRNLCVWSMDEGYCNRGSFWHLVHKIELKDMLADHKHCWFRDLEGALKYIKPVAFSPVDKNVVILDCYIYILAYNFQTRRSEIVRHPPLPDNSFCNQYEVSPFVLIPGLTAIPPSSWTDS